MRPLDAECEVRIDGKRVFSGWQFDAKCVVTIQWNVLAVVLFKCGMGFWYAKFMWEIPILYAYGELAVGSHFLGDGHCGGPSAVTGILGEWFQQILSYAINLDRAILQVELRLGPSRDVEHWSGAFLVRVGNGESQDSITFRPSHLIVIAVGREHHVGGVVFVEDLVHRGIAKRLGHTIQSAVDANIYKVLRVQVGHRKRVVFVVNERKFIRLCAISISQRIVRSRLWGGESCDVQRWPIFHLLDI